MKLGVVRRGFSPSGGAEAYLRRFAETLAAQGHAALLFTGEPWPAAAWPHEQRVVHGGRSPARFARALAAMNPRAACDFLFSLERVEQCDCYRAGDGVHAAWLGRRALVEPAWKTIFRQWQPKHREILRLEQMMFAEGGAQRVIANSQMVKQEIVAQYGYPAERIAVVYNGVPPAPAIEVAAAWRVEVRRELGLGEQDYVLLFAGSGWERKGLRWAIKAMERAKVSGTLIVAGRGKQRAMPRSARVRYIGATGSLPRYLAAADAFILPTLYDPFSNATLEAVAAGLPVITTAANGCAEILAETDGAVVERATDVAGLARGIERWSDAGLRAVVRERIAEKGAGFTPERNLRETLGVLGLE